MTEEELWNAVDGLMAYDEGATDSGIKDEDLRRRVIEQLKAMPDEQFIRSLSINVRESFLSEQALDAGYSIEDVLQLVRWLGENGIDV